MFYRIIFIMMLIYNFSVLASSEKNNLQIATNLEVSDSKKFAIIEKKLNKDPESIILSLKTLKTCNLINIASDISSNVKYKIENSENFEDFQNDTNISCTKDQIINVKLMDLKSSIDKSKIATILLYFKDEPKLDIKFELTEMKHN